MKEIGRWIVYSVIFALVVGIIWYYVLPNAPYYLFNIRKGISNIAVNPIETSTSECPKEISPERITLFDSWIYKDGSFQQPVNEFIDQKWGDGTVLDSNSVMKPDVGAIDPPGPDCRQGSAEGENVNYLYCKEVSYSPADTYVDDEGVIIKKDVNKYRVRLILRLATPIEEKMTDWGITYRIYRNYTIVSATCIKQ